MNEVAHAASIQPHTDVVTTEQFVDIGLVARHPALGDLPDLGIGNSGGQTTTRNRAIAVTDELDPPRRLGRLSPGSMSLT